MDFTDDYCCQLLATVYVFGSEDMIFGKRLNKDITVAQKRLNISGGHIPDGKLVSKLKEYVDELEQSIKRARKEQNGWGAAVSSYLPSWAQKIEEKYKTVFRE